MANVREITKRIEAKAKVVELTSEEWEAVRSFIDHAGDYPSEGPNGYALWDDADKVVLDVDRIMGRRNWRDEPDEEDESEAGNCDVCKGPCNIGDPS